MPFKTGYLLSKMLVLTTNAHQGQYDKAGLPYILHPLKVMHYLKTDDEELQCIALGHDLLEDTIVTCQDILNNFNDRIYSGINALTKLPDQSQESYEQQVLDSYDAMRVKLCDLRHNSDIRRLKGLREKDFTRLNKYCKFYQRIKDRLNDQNKERGI